MKVRCPVDIASRGREGCTEIPFTASEEGARGEGKERKKTLIEYKKRRVVNRVTKRERGREG